MSRKSPLTSSLIFFFIIAAFLFIWLLSAAPTFQEKERVVRSENAALAKDITEIKSMGGSTEALEKMMADTEGIIQQKYDSRADSLANVTARIESICAELGYTPSKLVFGQKTLLYPAGAFAPALYSVDITFLIESTEEAGAAVIRGFEQCTSSDFEIISFVYRAIPQEDNEAEYYGEWIFTAMLYYYE